MAKHDKVPPFNDPFEQIVKGMGPGSVDLSQVPQVPRTIHAKTTIFQSCTAGVFPVLNPDGSISHYQFRIQDPHDHHEYLFNFQQDLRENLTDMLLNLPAIGSTPDE